MKANQLPFCLLLLALISGGNLLAQGVDVRQNTAPSLEAPVQAAPASAPGNAEDARSVTGKLLSDPQHPVNPDPEAPIIKATATRQLTPAEIEELKDGK